MMEEITVSPSTSQALARGPLKRRKCSGLATQFFTSNNVKLLRDPPEAVSGGHQGQGL